MPGLLNPLQPRGWTGTWPFRRESPNSTGGTFTHEHCTLRGLLRGGLFIDCASTASLFLFFSGAALQAWFGSQVRIRAAEKQKDSVGWVPLVLSTGHPYGV
jgi:hypothetical protein